MNWVKEAVEKLYYIGDCINGLEDDNFTDIIRDATDMAQLVEDSRPLVKAQFLSIADVPAELTPGRKGMEFGFNEERHIGWMYDATTDTHYFFA